MKSTLLVGIFAALVVAAATASFWFNPASAQMADNATMGNMTGGNMTMGPANMTDTNSAESGNVSGVGGVL